MKLSAKTLAVCLLLCACNNPPHYFTSVDCPSGDEGWKTCFAGCASPELRTLATSDPDDYVEACSYACEKACTKPMFKVFRGGNVDWAIPCESSKGGARNACKRDGWKP